MKARHRPHALLKAVELRKQNGARPQQQVPVILARVEREMGWNGRQERPFQRQDPVELREAKVVANGQTDEPALDLGDDGLVAVLLVYEQSLVSEHDLSQVKRAFDLNGYVGILYFLATAASLYVH